MSHQVKGKGILFLCHMTSPKALHTREVLMFLFDWTTAAKYYGYTVMHSIKFDSLLQMISANSVNELFMSAHNVLDPTTI